MSPYLAFQLYSVASEMPCLRARSAVFAPASCSRRTAMICSSVNLIRFIVRPFLRPDSNSEWRKSSVAGHRDEGLWWVCNRVTYVSRLKHQPGKAEVACTHGHLEQCSILTPAW